MAAVSEEAGRVFGQVETPPVIWARTSAEEERSERKAFSCGGQTGLILRVSRLGRVTFDHPLVSDYKLSMKRSLRLSVSGGVCVGGGGLQISSVFCFK